MKRADLWTEAEIAILKAHKPVPGRTSGACYTKAFKLGLDGYHPVNPKTAIHLDAEMKDRIAEQVRRTGKVRATARMFGVSYTTVTDICKERGINRDPPSTARLSDHIEWGDSKWVWCGDYWRETSGKRRNLARVLWEHYNGNPVPEGLSVVFLDGDRCNLSKGNLAAMTKSEQGTYTMQSERNRAMAAAGAAVGRLSTILNEMANPESRRERIRKSVATRRANRGYGYRSANKSRNFSHVDLIQEGNPDAR